MPRQLQTRLLSTCTFVLAVAFLSAQAQPKHDKVVTNLDGGVFMETDGSFPDGPCFRVKGRMDAPKFFENLKREDTLSGTLYRRGNDIVTNFPPYLQLSLVIFDLPCDTSLHYTGSRLYLTDALIRTLRLSFYWKRGLDMRPARGIIARHFEISPVGSFYQGIKDPPPQRYEWFLDFDVPGEGVPLTDSLVLILRTPDQHIVARTAARL
jgi:hypothetical protein